MPRSVGYSARIARALVHELALRLIALLDPHELHGDVADVDRLARRRLRRRR